MSAPHLIERLDVAFEFDAPDPALQDEQQLLRLVRESLLSVLDEVMDACDEPGAVLVLPSLALDLGMIERHALREQAPARLRALLEDALAAARQQARLAAAVPPARAMDMDVAGGDTPRLGSANDHALARLAAFLRSGRLGWDAPLGRGDLHVEWLDRLLDATPGELVRMLAGAVRQPDALLRLARQFPPRQLEAILELAAPGQARALLAWRAAAAAPDVAWTRVLGVALGAAAPAAALAMVCAALGDPRAALAPLDGERLAVWWRRGERDAGAEAVLERLLAGGGVAAAAGRDGLARALGAALLEPDAARRLAGAMSSRLRERLLRFLLPSGAAGLLALMTDVERQLVSRVGDRRRAAEAHARCWLELLAAALDGAGVVMRNDVVRARLLAVLDAAVLDAAELEAAAPERGQFAAPEGAAPDELAQLAAFLERGRFEDAPALEVSLQGALHVTLLERLLERARRGRAPREALLRMLAATLASPRALRRLLGQFPQRQLAGIVHVAMPGQAAALLALLLEAQDGARLDQPALEDDVRDAWGGLVLRALREGWPAAFGAAHDAGQEDAPNRAQPAGLEAWWRSGRFDPAGAARLDALLATVETEGVEGRARAALAAAVARVLSAPDGALRLARALPERLRESLIRFALPGLAPRAIALMQRLRAHHVQAPESCIEAWARLLTACLAPPVSAAAVQALCERLDTTLMPAPARLEAPGAPLEQLPLDELEAWWRAGQADPARAARMERMLALATAVGGDGGPGAGRPLAKALVAALARTVALPEGPRRLAAALPEELGIALLWFAVPALAPRLVALLRRLGRRRASTPDAWRDCWSQVYALCLGPAPSSAAVDALCRRLEDAATPPDAAPRARDANPGRRRTKGALDGFAAWWRSGHADHGRAAQLERLLAVGAAGMAGSPDAAQAGELEGALAAALQRTLASPGGARRLVSAMPVHLREALLARLAPAFASAVIVRLHALARQLALAPGAAGPAPGLHTLSWAQVFEACLSPTATAASVQALCARLDEVVGRVARHDQDRAREGRRERAPGGTAARHGASALERLTAFLRKGRLLGAHAAARPAGQQHGPDAEVHVALLDGLLASPSLQPLWRMLADALARPAAARRMVEQFPERQLRDVLARATPVLAVALCALADELQRSGLEAGVAPRRLRLLLWPALLGAAVRAAAGLAPLPPLKALRAQALDRLAVPPDQTGAEQDGAQWLARIAGHLERDGRIAPARRADMMEAIAAAARASGGAQACLRAVMEVLERGAPLDLEAIVRQRGAAAPEASVAARTASEPRSAMVAALPAAGGGPPPPAARRPAVVPAPTAGAGDDTPGLPAGERIALGNAGMVLMAPYLPRLFGMLGLVADGAFVDLDAAGRAAHLLQFAVSGASSTPEYALPLNKLLCGLPLATPVVAGIAPTPAERETIEGLLEAMIASWSALGRTSVEGLRQSFLMRDGELALGPQGWELSVVRGPFDVLMDRLPWSFSIVRFAWMPAPVHVTWH